MSAAAPWNLLAARSGQRWDEAIFRNALARRAIVEERWGAARFYRVEKDLGDVARGTAIVEHGLVPDYPHIPRVLHLSRGLARNFDGPFRAEEKVDGYNVRIVRTGGEVIALTRGGFVCPFSTDRLADWPEIARLLEKRPELIVCAEIAGPGSPYNREHPPAIKEDIALFAFDLGRTDAPGYLAPAERRRILEAAGVPRVRDLGTFEPHEAARVYDVVRRLDEEGGEGVVLKAERGPARVKYVCLGADARDIAATAGCLGAIPRAFFVNRLVQAAFTIHEWRGAPTPEEARRFGEALLGPMVASIAAVEGGAPPGEEPRGEIEEPYEIFFREERHVDRFIRHLDRSSASVQIRVLERARVEATGRWRVRFMKKYQKATGYFLSRLLGTTFVD